MIFTKSLHKILHFETRYDTDHYLKKKKIKNGVMKDKIGGKIMK